MVPLLRRGAPWEQIHPAINAMLNASCFIFLLAGRAAIARGRERLHRKFMLRAFAASSVFLASYLLRFAMSGTHRYAGHGWDKGLYLAILFSHMLLATAVVPLVLRSIFLALKGQRKKHARLVRWTWPIWAYVSITGVVVYVMLYRL